MNSRYDKYNRPIVPKIFLGTPNNKIICQLDGIDANTFKHNPNLTNTHTISFDVNRKYSYMNLEGRTVETESNAFKLIGLFLRVYVENIGWFIINPPESNNDGTQEKYSITAQSAEIEFQQHNLINLKMNQGTTDSYEMLVDGNVDMIGDVEFAKEQIKFYNSAKPELSFLDLVLKVGGITGWSVGEIDPIPGTYTYFEDGEKKEKQTLLSDEIGVFDIDSQDVYSFLTQEASKFFNCIFVFDFDNMKINAYHPEHYGKDTNININFKNFQNSIDIQIDDSKIFTRYYVQGSDNLGIEYVNFGSNVIENIDYYLNEKYLKATTIYKYKLWKQDVEDNRNTYIENTRLYNEQYNKISELTNRVPLDDCSTDWSTFGDDKLLEARANYQAQQKGYESYYVDDDGNFDEEALKNSVDANDYYQIRDVILPSIQIEIDNRNLPSGVEEGKYIDTYKTDWKLYGLNELDTNIQIYKNNIKLATDEGCDVPYSDTSKKSKDYHDALYKKYQEAEEQLDGTNPESCISYYNKIKSQIDELTELQNFYDNIRKNIINLVNKETWTHGVNLDSSNTLMDENDNYIVDENGNYIVFFDTDIVDDTLIRFTEEDLEQLSKLYVDGAFTNDNMLITDSDDSVTTINEQLKLYDAAKDDLYITSHPQYKYSTTVNNFLALFDYKHYVENLNIGDYIYLQIHDTYVEKLRVVSMEYNPLVYDNDFQITFSNMIQGRNSRNDIFYILDNSGNSSNNSSTSSSTSNRYTINDGVSLSPALIQRLVQSGAFADKITQIVNKNFSSVIGGSITLEELNAKMIKVSDIIGENAFFEYLQSKFISTDKIVASSGTFTTLSSLVAQIDSLLAGTVTTEMAHIIKLTAENVTIDEAVIRELIAANITVSMLKAGDINTDSFHVKSTDGSFEIVGNTMQFKDENNVVRIQIGRDSQNNFTFCLYDETGNGVLIDSTGIKESAISDGLIKNDMVANGTIGKEKMNFQFLEPNDQGGLDAGKVFINGKGIDVEFTSIRESISALDKKITDNPVITFQIGTPNGNILSDNIQSITLNANLMNSGISISEDTTYQWYSYDYTQKKYVELENDTTISIEVTRSMVDSTATFKCIATYNTKEYTAYCSVLDKTDPVQAYCYCSIGDKISDDEKGVGALYMVIYQNGVEIDPIKSYTFSTTPPDSASEGDFYYFINETNKTIELKKYKNNTWGEPNSEDYPTLSYEWYRRDQNGKDIDTLTPYKTGKAIYVDRDIVKDINNKKKIFRCRYKSINESKYTVDENNNIVMNKL